MQAGKAEGKGSACVKGTSVQRSHVGGGTQGTAAARRSGVSLEQRGPRPVPATTRWMCVNPPSCRLGRSVALGLQAAVTRHRDIWRNDHDNGLSQCAAAERLAGRVEGE